MRKILYTALVLALLSTPFSFAHPGRTDASGCHTCKTNCSKWGLETGEYHCHRSKGIEQPKEPVKSSATGVTVPAPEYKVQATKEMKKEGKVATSTYKNEQVVSRVPSSLYAPQKSWLSSFLEVFK